MGSRKRGAREHFADELPVLDQVLIELPAIMAKHPSIACAVEKAARSGFRSDNLRRKTVSKAVSSVASGSLPAETVSGVDSPPDRP
jgi:hypothetical protein